jgi:hypothetical protein
MYDSALSSITIELCDHYYHQIPEHFHKSMKEFHIYLLIVISHSLLLQTTKNLIPFF